MARLPPLRRTVLLPLLALGLATLLGGCVVYPDGYGYGYGYQPAPYYGGAYVGYGGGWHHHHRGW
jgi:hypothetical protein